MINLRGKNKRTKQAKERGREMEEGQRWWYKLKSKKRNCKRIYSKIMNFGETNYQRQKKIIKKEEIKRKMLNIKESCQLILHSFMFDVQIC